MIVNVCFIKGGLIPIIRLKANEGKRYSSSTHGVFLLEEVLVSFSSRQHED